MAVSAQASSSMEQTLFKKNLQELAQRLGTSFPVFQTRNEGFAHAPQFRSTVIIDGATFCSSHTFPHRKAAEQDVSKIALEGLYQKLYNEALLLISEDPTFCKQILNEYAVKMHKALPTYQTAQCDSSTLPVFFSSVTFDDVKYNGGAGKNKKEAEQFAAREALQSILRKAGDSTVRNPLPEIIKSKIKLYATFDKAKRVEAPIALFLPEAQRTTPQPLSNVSTHEPVTINSLCRAGESGGPPVLSGKAPICGTSSKETQAATTSSPPVVIKREPGKSSEKEINETDSGDAGKVIDNIKVKEEVVDEVCIISSDSNLGDSEKAKKRVGETSAGAREQSKKKKKKE
ncbi:double-stranded RNA-binding protein 2 [Amborella trichopoda]|uniref:double-stranded RNA-binding protein 2 n=1 Tax=Amborella trichopoda TaxID=13333 RepID=UPI0005D35BC8|nr:double-stranded RNA-binding protein 2 [Amborella trichopoda]|eukprot:XP_011625327.1 double-stranded RNA-binding protein 2 [Amborella trichopoda]